MGGNAIKDPKTNESICKRLDKSDYDIVVKYLFEILEKHEIKYEKILELPGKKDFGDIDIMYLVDQNFNMENFIRKNINLDESWHITTSDKTTSFALNCNIFGLNQYFQIDLIGVSSFEMPRFYFSYGDIGSIIGRIATYYGLKFGQNGLWCDLSEYIMKHDEKIDVRINLGKILFSDDPKEICKFLDFDYDFWENEIPMLTTDVIPIFNWITRSRLFNSKIFVKMNNDHRERFQKRNFYKNFCNFIGIESIQSCNNIDGEKDKHANLQLDAIKYFKKEKQAEELMEFEKNKRIRKTKFTGDDVIGFYKEIHNVKFTGSKFGDKLFEIKTLMSKNNNITWEECLDNFSREEILKQIEKIIRADNIKNG